jgi:hypothetical protein
MDQRPTGGVRSARKYAGQDVLNDPRQELIGRGPWRALSAKESVDRVFGRPCHNQAQEVRGTGDDGSRNKAHRMDGAVEHN